jgi:ADP-ribose pyrophosphatase
MTRPKTGRTVKFEGRFLRLVDVDTWEFVERSNCDGAVVIIAMNPEREVVLIEQFRPPVGKSIIEFPAGLVGDSGSSEKFEVAALRELEEETGYTAEKVTYLTIGPTAPGLSTELIAFVLAEGLTKVSAGGGIGSESIIIHEVPLDEIENWLKQKQDEGLLVDLKVYAGLYFLQKQKK